MARSLPSVVIAVIVVSFVTATCVGLWQPEERALHVALALDALCTALAVGGWLAMRAALRARDAMAERHLQAEKERASELEAFAGRVAHDILSPLGSVGLALQLAGQARTETDRVAALQRGTAGLHRVKRIVGGLLEFARAGAPPDAEACASVADVMADLGVELETTASASGVELVMRPGDAIGVACHPGVLTSLIANLAQNAIKYMGPGSTKRVEVRASTKGEYVRVEVEDTGPGLPPEIERRVFDVYARGRGTNDRAGIGLGLATVRRLAEAHRGRVGVVSEPGVGCAFWFELPRASLPDAVPAARVA